MTLLKKILAGFVILSVLTFNTARAQINVTDSLALVALYNATDGANWTNNTNWLTGDVPTWFGIVVTLNRVRDINLGTNQLSGTIPPEVGNISNLRWLNLIGNQLTGTIPVQIGNLANLNNLYLGSNQLTGTIPPELGNLTSIRFFDLSDNLLTGTIPIVLGSLLNLEWLDLFKNQFTGPIPVEFGNLINLISLRLYSNQLSGSIPMELQNSPGLTRLEIYNNLLTGSIPVEIGNLTNLQVLRMGSNQLTGPIPPELGNLLNLQELRLGYNLLTGPIPSTIGSLSNLVQLLLTSNQLSGPIPPELGNLASLQWMLLSGNLLTGSIPPEIGNLVNLQLMYLKINQLTGPIPPELGNLSNLQTLNLGVNQLSGAIPPELGNLSSLTNLWLFSNQLTGPLPSELGNLLNLQFLMLYDNLITGPIPASLGSLSLLEHLILYNNQLSGTIPPELGNMTNLVNMSLNSNQLTGSIPPELGNMTNLVDMGLSDNLLTGPIPPELGNLLNIFDIMFENNQLSGTLPPELGNLLTLVELSLRGNQLSGTIPPEFGNLLNLQWLTIDSNLFSGSVPLSFTNLTSLSNFTFYSTQLCEPDSPVYFTWKAGVFNYSGTGVVCGPEIDVFQNTTPVASGSTFGYGQVLATTDTLLTIQNTGTEILNINSISISAGDFSLLNQVPGDTISAGQSVTISVRFSSTNPGIKTGILTIVSNDSDESTYTINLTGEIVLSGGPEIKVLQNGDSIANAGTFNFGQVTEKIIVDTLFTIENIGTSVLYLNTFIINGPDFKLTGTLPDSLNAGENVDITIRFSPTNSGTKTDTLTIASNDADEGIYTIIMSGEAIPASPEITIFQNVIPTVTGDTYNFGYVPQMMDSDAVFTIENEGNAVLFINNIVVTGADFSLVGTLPDSIVAGGKSNVTVRFTPTGSGIKNATLTISCNDPDESTFTINLSGEGVSAPVAEDLSETITVGESINFDVLSLAAYDVGQLLTTILILPPNPGSYAINSDQSISYFADSAYAGFDEIEYELCNQYDLCGKAAITIEITNAPPEITLESIQTKPATRIEIDISEYIYDPNGFGITDVEVTNTSFNETSIEIDWSNKILIIDYSTSFFTGVDIFTLTACDLTGDCTDKTIRVAVGELENVFVYNAVSPNGDGLHDFLKILDLEFFAENEVVIYNRLGSLVWRQEGYSNIDLSKAFTGVGDDGSRLLNGTYYFFISLASNSGEKYSQSGFFVLNR